MTIFKCAPILCFTKTDGFPIVVVHRIYLNTFHWREVDIGADSFARKCLFPRLTTEPLNGVRLHGLSGVTTIALLCLPRVVVF